MASRPSAFPGDRRVLAAFGRLQQVPTWLAVLACLAGIALIATLDGLTGDDVSLSLFYMAAVGSAAWAVRLRTAVLLALVAAVAGFLVALAVDTATSTTVDLLNAAFRFLFYAAFAYASALLRNIVAELERRASIDSATGMLSRQAFYERAEDERLRARRIGYPLTIALLDMDNLKEVNDRFGHEAGDGVIEALADAIHDTVRTIDVVGRIGGDEFLLLLPDTDAEGAHQVLARIDDHLHRSAEGTHGGFSAGIAAWKRIPGSVDDMVREADRLMYEAKHHQRGTVRAQTFPDVDEPVSGSVAPATEPDTRTTTTPHP